MNRRAFFRNASLLAAGAVAADQLELVERLGWKRRFFAGWSEPAYPTALTWKQDGSPYHVPNALLDYEEGEFRITTGQIHYTRIGHLVSAHAVIRPSHVDALVRSLGGDPSTAIVNRIPIPV